MIWMANHIRGSTVGFRENRIFGKRMRESSFGAQNDFCKNGPHGSLGPYGPYWDLDLEPWALLGPGPWALGPIGAWTLGLGPYWDLGP